jgi:hydrogenase maturation protease
MGWRAGTLGKIPARLPDSMKTILIGLGNPILGDDGVGWKVVDEVQKQLSLRSPLIPLLLGRGNQVDVEFLSLGGISLMEHLVGYQRAILVDAVASNRPVGSVVVWKLSELPDYSGFHTTSPHDTSLQNALRLGKTMGAILPEEVTVVGVSASHVYDFSEELSAPVAGAIPEAIEIIIRLLA